MIAVPVTVTAVPLSILIVDVATPLSLSVTFHEIVGVAEDNKAPFVGDKIVITGAFVAFTT